MGEDRFDIHINIAQNLLKVQFLRIAATIIGSGGNSVVVYDSAIKSVDRETKENVYNPYLSTTVRSSKYRNKRDHRL